MSGTESQSRPTIDVAIVNGPVDYAPPPPLPNGGGESVFLGRTRAETSEEFGQLITLEYEAYEPMAVRRLRELAVEVAGTHQASHIVIRHSIGRVPVGSASVFIQVLCPHRDQSFAACRMLIDRLKTDVPIWKRDVWERGQRSWKDGTPVDVPGSPK